MEDVLWPILERYTSTDGQDIFEEVMQLATYLTYFAPTLSPRMWSLYPRMVQVRWRSSCWRPACWLCCAVLLHALFQQGCPAAADR